MTEWESRLSGIESRLTLLTWMVGTNVLLTLLLLGSTFALWSKLSDFNGQLAQIAALLNH